MECWACPHCSCSKKKPLETEHSTGQTNKQELLSLLQLLSLMSLIVVAAADTAVS
jgi:hypothetical protein